MTGSHDLAVTRLARLSSTMMQFLASSPSRCRIRRKPLTAGFGLKRSCSIE